MTVRYSRNGKLRFLRIGRLCLSFCIANPKAEDRTSKAEREAVLLVTGAVALLTMAVVAFG